MKGLLFLVFAWVVASIFTIVTEFSYFESFVIVTLGYVFMKSMDGDRK